MSDVGPLRFAQLGEVTALMAKLQAMPPADLAITIALGKRDKDRKTRQFFTYLETLLEQRGKRPLGAKA